jgi:hypothetical protein
MAQMAERGHPAGRTDRARRALEVETVRQGRPGIRQRFFWRLPTSCPTCLRAFGPDGVSVSAPWDEYRAGSGDYWSNQASPIEPPPSPPEVRPPPPPAAPVPHSGPPRCNACQRTAALDSGSACPYWTASGQRCPGRMT